MDIAPYTETNRDARRLADAFSRPESRRNADLWVEAITHYLDTLGQAAANMEDDADHTRATVRGNLARGCPKSARGNYYFGFVADYPPGRFGDYNPCRTVLRSQARRLGRCDGTYLATPKRLIEHTLRHLDLLEHRAAQLRHQLADAFDEPAQRGKS